MPIEIRELIIKARVAGEDQAEASSSASGEDKKEERLIEESVGQVLEILQRKEER